MSPLDILLWMIIGLIGLGVLGFVLKVLFVVTIAIVAGLKARKEFRKGKR